MAAARELEEQAWNLAPSDVPAARRLWERTRSILIPLVDGGPHDFEALYDLAYAYDREGRQIGKRDLGALRELHAHAAEYYRRAIKLQPFNAAPHNSFGLMWDHGARLTAPHDLPAAHKLWELSYAEFADALALHRTHHAAANNLGNALGAEATAFVKENFEFAQKRWDLALNAYDAALAIKPDKVNARTNRGIVLAEMASAYIGRDPLRARELWSAAGKEFELACKVDRTYADASAGWGHALMGEAKHLANSDLPHARELWAKARVKLKDALALNPQDLVSAINLMLCMEREALNVRAAGGAEAPALFDRAIQAAHEVLRLSPQSAVALGSLGSCMNGKARCLAQQDRDAARALWRQASVYYAQSFALEPTSLTSSNWARSLSNEAAALAQQDRDIARERWQEAGERYATAASLRPSDLADVHANWGAALLEWAQTEPQESTMAFELLDAAAAKYAQAHAIKPAAFLLERSGTVLHERAQRLSRTEPAAAIVATRRAEEYFRAALLLNPRETAAEINWALVLAIEAECLYSTDVAQADARYAAAIELMQRLVQRTDVTHSWRWADLITKRGRRLASYDPQRAEVLWNEAEHFAENLAREHPAHSSPLGAWALIFMVQAEEIGRTDPTAAVPILDRAIQLFERCNATPPASAKWLEMAASACLSRGDLTWRTTPAKSYQDWLLAAANCEQALAVAPHSVRGTNTWALALMRLYGYNPSPAALPFLERAEQLLRKSSRGEPGAVAYNLACVYALQHQAEATVRWLEIARVAGQLPSRTKVLSDTYLAMIRDSPEFTRWITSNLNP